MFYPQASSLNRILKRCWCFFEGSSDGEKTNGRRTLRVPPPEMLMFCPQASSLYRVVRAVLIEQLFFPNFSSFFSQEKQKKQEKQETFPKFGNLTEGKIFGTLRFPIFGIFLGGGNMEILRTKNCAKNK